MSDIMIDLETMGISKDAAIISIGAISFNSREEFKPEDTFYKIINLKSAQRAGGRIDSETVIWWMGQEELARKALIGDDSVLIEVALKEFSEWIRKYPVEGVWGNGSDFDNVILEGAYQRLGWMPPWSHKINRCYRTLCALAPDIKREEFQGVRHNALDDAIFQARHLCEVRKQLGA